MSKVKTNNMISQYLQIQDEPIKPTRKNDISYRYEIKLDNGIDFILQRFKTVNENESLYDELVFIPSNELFYIRRKNVDKEITQSLLQNFLISYNTIKTNMEERQGIETTHFLKILCWNKHHKNADYKYALRVLSYGVPIAKIFNFSNYVCLDNTMSYNTLKALYELACNKPKVLSYIAQTYCNKYSRHVIDMVNTYSQEGVNYNDIVYMLESIKDADIRIETDFPIYTNYNLDFRRMVDYITRDLYYQGIDSFDYSSERTYRDYLSMCSEMYKDNNKSFDKYPRYLKTQHDMIVRRYNIYHKLYQDDNIKNIADKYKNLVKEVDKFKFYLPETSDEILEEGRNQHNCVASYINNYSEGKCILVFVRNKKTPEESYLTLELSLDLEIVQAKGLCNRELTKDEKKLVDKWYNNIKK